MFVLRKKYKKIKEENITLIQQIEDLEKQLSIEKAKSHFGSSKQWMAMQKYQIWDIYVNQ